MKILVTGGAGFIGSHLVEKLKKENCQVIVLDNLHSGLKENLPDDIPFVEMDVRDEKLFDFFAKEKFDAVVHLAAQTMVNVSLEDPKNDADINIMGGVNVLEACRKTGVKRVIFSSSAAVYGDIEKLPIEEKFATIPTSFYGLSKLTYEKYLELYQKNYGLDYIIFRFANVYGERQGDGGEGGVISIFAKQIAKKQAISIFGDGGQTRDFIYAGDIADAIYKCLQSPKANTIYNLSNKTETSVNKLVEFFSNAAGYEIKPEYKPARLGDIYRSILDNQNAVKDLGWQPVVPLQEGLKRTYQYFLE